jgi:putative spermidine/putrescine transport system substrate-binding protein
MNKGGDHLNKYNQKTELFVLINRSVPDRKLSTRRYEMSKKIVTFVGLLVALMLAVSACTPAPTAAPVATEAVVTEVPTVDPMVQLVADAQAEGTIVTYGLPESWANYGGLMAGYTAEYGIPQMDTDLGSGEIISTLIAEAAAPVADTTDLGMIFAKDVLDNNLSQPYENAYWAELPDYAKDPNGLWSAAFWGAAAFLVNADKVPNVPLSWADLLKPEYASTICMKNPASSATAQMMVLGAAYANGGGITNVQPGLDYFQQLLTSGAMLDASPSSSNIQKGECPIAIQWDFDALSNKYANPTMNLQVVIPSDGTVGGMYIQFVTVGAPHPNAAKLLMEYEYSDAGQLAYAAGFVHPVRTSVVIPDEILSKMPPAADYAAVNFPTDVLALNQASIDIANGWAIINP